MLQIGDLIWGLLFIGCAGKKMTYLLFILGESEAVAKAQCEECRPSCADSGAASSGPACGILVTDSGQWRWVRDGALHKSTTAVQKVSLTSESVLSV